MRDLDYDRLSPRYDGRYRVNPLAGVERAIGRVVDEIRPALSLDVGCGTGRWLPELVGTGGRAIGLDPSPGMLAEAPQGHEQIRLVCADGDALPFGRSTLDLVLSVNAVHHLAEPGEFIRRCADHLCSGGGLALVHYDPDRDGQSWYVYDDFPGAREADLARFPRQEQLTNWMRDAGFESIECGVVETIERHYSGRAVLDDYFLGRDSNSTLARLADEAYERGLAKLLQRIDRAEASGEAPRFDVRLDLLLLTARKP